LLEKHFTIDIDYQVVKAAPPNCGAAFEESKSPSKNLGGAGMNKEQIMLTINTFKKFCLKSETKKADEVHDYYIKLEELLQETINEVNAKKLKKQPIFQKIQLKAPGFEQFAKNVQVLKNKNLIINKGMHNRFIAYIKSFFDKDDESLEHYIRDINTYSNN